MTIGCDLAQFIYGLVPRQYYHDTTNPFVQRLKTLTEECDTTRHIIYKIILTILYAILIYEILRKFNGTRRYPIAPGYIPLIGHALSLSNSDEFLSVLLRWKDQVGNEAFFGEKGGSFSGAYEFSILGQRWVVLCNAHRFMEAFKLRPYKIKRASKMSEAIESLGVKGVFNAEGQQWKNDRRLVGPQLNKNHIQDYFPNIKLVARRLVAKWENENGTVSTVMSDLYKYSLDITALSIIGIDFDVLDNPHNQLANDIGELFEVIFKRSLSPIQYWKLPFCGNLDGGSDLSERVMGTLKRVVDDYRKVKLQRQQHDKNGVQGNGNGTPKTFLQKLVDISDGDDKKLEEERVVGNLATLLFAGTDTTSTTIAVCLWEVANDSILQDELYQEVIESGLLDHDNLTLTDVLSGFPRLHSFLYEVLRTKGPGAFFFLEPAERVEILGRTLYPGTIICALTALGDENFVSIEIPTGPNDEGPEVFCPQRWLKHTPEGLLSVIKPANKDGAYMPFGHGARVCPGASLAIAEAVTCLFSILKRFELASIENHPPLRRVTRFTQTFDSEIQLTLKPRQ